MSPPLPITEDTPPDMLAGAMDLHVVLPNGQDMKMSVERSTPMMDLLVQVTTANKISPGGHVIQAIGDRGILPYKPSTPIGALDTWTIHIVSKKQAGNMYARKPMPRPVNQSTPFEQTFRLQVNLPRNQLYVSRVSYKVRLEDVLREVCKEKNLDQSKYCFIHPEKLDEELDLSKTFLDYKLQQVTLTSRSNRPVGLSSADIMALKRYDNGSQHVNNQYYASHSYDGSISSGSIEGRSLSPVRSDESSSSPTIQKTTTILGRPLRKRRPAPKPPSIQNERNSKHVTTTETLTISHSRNSSDSSGYHESSVLSESPESNSNSLANSLPRRSKLPSEDPHDNELTSHQRPRSSKYTNGKIGNSLSRSLSNLAVIGNKKSASNNMLLNGMKPKEYSTSSTSLASIPGKKKKAPAPPPPSSAKSLLSLKEEEAPPDLPSATHTPPETLQKCQTLPATAKLSEESTTTSSSARLPCHNSTSSENDFASRTVDDCSQHNPNLPVDEVDSAPICSDGRSTMHTKSKDKELTMDDEEIDRIFSDATKDYETAPVSTTAPSPVESGTNNHTVNSCSDQVEDASHDWKYKLPSPPQAFRDQECNQVKSNNHVVSTKNKENFVKEKRLTALETADTTVKSNVIANNLKNAMYNNECHNDRNQPKRSSGETFVNGDKFRSSSVTKISHQQEDLERAALISKEAVKAVEVSRSRTLQREQSAFDASSCDTYLSTNDSGLGSDDSIPSMSDGKYGLDESCYANGGGAKSRRTDMKMPERRNTLQNFTITTYQNSNSKPTEIFHDDSVKTSKTTQLAQTKHTYNKISEENCATGTSSAALSRHSSFSTEKLSNSMVKRSKSHISLLSGNFTKFNRLNKFGGAKTYAEEDAGTVSASSENLCYYKEESKSRNGYATSHLRRTASEDSVNKDCVVKEEEEEHQEEETKCSENERRSSVVLDTMKNVQELQSVQLLKGILPQINRPPAQSVQNSTSAKIASTEPTVTSTNGPTVMIRTRTSNDHQPAVNLQSWSERPKRQVSIKTDRDYVFGNNHRLSASDSRDNDTAGEDRHDSSISNGDTRKEIVDRVPVVRAVEFKKPFARQNNVSGEPSKYGIQQRTDDIIKPKLRPSSFYLFGEHGTNSALQSPNELSETFVNEIHNLKNASSSSSAAKRYSIGAISEVSSETNGNKVENYTFKTYKNKYGNCNSNRRLENGGSTTNVAGKPSNTDSSNVGATIVTTRPNGGVPSAPVPPPLSFLRSTSNQRCGISQKAFANEDPRDTLLASIKSFNRDNLKKLRA